MSIFNASRLAVARKRRGLTKLALAERVGISGRMVTAYESEEKQPSVHTLVKIADALDFPFEFFGGADLPEPPEYGVSFRALSKLTARQRDQAISSATLALTLSRWIDSRFIVPEPDVPHLATTPEAAAAEIRRAWGLGEHAVGNSVHLLEVHGVRVFSLAGECSAVDAFSFWREDRPYVFLNTMKSAEHSRMDAAHELGHLILHHGHDVPHGRQAEEEAHAFGRALLMPKGSVVASGLSNATLEQLIRAKKRWNVSLAALVYRLHEVGMLSDWHYRTHFIEMGRCGYRSREPNSIHRETSQLLAKVFGLLRASGLSKGDVAKAIAFPLDELNKVVFGLVLTPIAGTDRHDDTGGRPELRVV